jgi:hypothetical protein
VKRIAPIRVMCFVLAVTCGAMCQDEGRSRGLLQGDGSNSPEGQRQEMSNWRSLPDAPSTVQPPRQAEKFRPFASEARSPLTNRATGISSGRRETDLRHVTRAQQPSSMAAYELLFSQKQPSNFVLKYLCPPLVKRSLLYHPSTSNTLIGRATYAASNIFVRREDSGRKRLNTSYFLGVLSLVAVHNARRPYWARSTSSTFNDFGSTIGDDAGINLFHEFEPGIRQMVKSHTPRFAFKIDQNLKVVSSPAR